MNKDNRNYQINRMKHQLDQKPITKVDRFKMKKVKKVWVFACAVTTIFGVNAIMEMVPETQTIESVASSNKNESTVKEIKLEKPTFNIVKNTNKKLVLDLVFNGSFQGKTGTVDDVYVSIKSFSPVKLHLSDNIKPYEKLEGKMTIIDDNKIRMEFNVKNEGDLYDVYNITNGKVKNSFLTSPAYIIDDDTKIESYTPIQSQYVNELVKFGNDK